MFQTLFNSAERLACSSPESSRYWLERYLIDLVLAAAASNILYDEFACSLVIYVVHYPIMLYTMEFKIVIMYEI